MAKRRQRANRSGLGAGWQWMQGLTRCLVIWFLRGLLRFSRRPLLGEGFVLPTTILMLLVLSLSVGSITLRTYTRTQEAVGDRQQQVVFNAATPAIDRAKAKLEYLFNSDPRFPNGIPSEDVIDNLLGDGAAIIVGVDDAYTFPDEDANSDGTPDRLDLDGDGESDNAWAYRTDTDGDGTDDATVAYAIIFETPDVDDPPMTNSSDAGVAARASQLQVRNAPLSGSNKLTDACQLGSDDAGVVPIEGGWFEDRRNSTVLRKNFQVDVYVLPDNANDTVSTLEFQQDRILRRGNKWGAWFRNDLEIFPGPRFNWNGAMHTAGNLIVGGNDFRGYLISAPSSCLYDFPSSSEVTVADVRGNEAEFISPFQGQIISGTVKNNSFGTTETDHSRFHLFGESPITSGDANVRLDLDSDSVIDEANDPKPADYTLDPIALVTKDVSVARGISGGDPRSKRDSEVWDAEKPFVAKARIYNQLENPPYLDDFYRADNRYGPKPRYQNKLIPDTVTIGEAIAGDLMAADELSDEVLTKDDPTGDNTDYGLDGYWERRAQDKGLRLIVGQRLELGNASGWGTDFDGNGVLDEIDADGNGLADEREAEPLYPANACPSSRCHETLQRRTLRDNLAAVQSMAIYHTAASAGGDFPLACFALTAHPGTAPTIKDSRTFESVSIDGTASVKTDFLTGRGTNGWEFAPPAADGDAFADAIAPDQPLGKALRNLAHFAGDPAGGAPSFPPVQEASGGVIHPYPYLTMWGDYSALRRVLAMLDGLSAAQGNPLDDGEGTADKLTYAELSPADKSTLHTAACTLGMLAHNLDIYTQPIPKATLTQLGTALWELVDGEIDNGEINGEIGLSPPADRTPDSVEAADAAADFYYDLTLDKYVSALKEKGLTAYDAIEDEEELDELVELLTMQLQIRRDRSLGFADGWFPTKPTNNSSDFEGWVDANTQFDEGLIEEAPPFRLRTACDPDIFDNRQITATDPNDRDKKKLGLALAFCRATALPKYPSLYYLFPRFEHDQNGFNDTYDEDESDKDIKDFRKKVDIDHRQPDNFEEYVTQCYIKRPRGSSYCSMAGGVNENYRYKVVVDDADDADDGVEEGDDNPFETIKVEPRALDFSDWLLPVANSGVNPIYDDEGEVLKSLPFLDKGIYNGREMMGLRVLDLDLDLMRNDDSNLDEDHWLPDSGVIYAFREDAVREDGIVRPVGSGADWATCGHNAVFEATDTENNGICRMEADPASPQDPPLDDRNLISPKAVDYYPDPDRRPHGFRLRNGEKLDRGLTNPLGLSFIADNPVYIQGSFNLHQTATCNGEDSCRLEEFQTKLNDSYNNFYSRNVLDSRFARPDADLWRPSEILADAITILSDDFCDGSVEDTFLTAGSGNDAAISDSEDRYGCSGNDDRTSYLNQNRPNTALAETEAWQREAGDASPILVSRNGHPIVVASDGSKSNYSDGNYFAFSAGKPLIGAQNERVNAIIISGLVPSRPNQSYGGLHNFPRFISNWDTLYISGAFLQLNFSNYATAPFDQDAWETNENARNPEPIRYYNPPNRRWGYDVGLQYAPAGPIAERFVSSESVRSEFYSEPPADDEYIVMLCRAIAPNPTQTCAR